MRRIKIIIKKFTQERMHPVIFVYAACCLLPASAVSQVLPLDSVFSRVEKNNPALLSYENKINSANELVTGSRALPPPKAGIMLDDNPYGFGFGPKVINFSVTQNFPNTGELNAKENYLKSIADISMYEGEQLKNQLFARVKITYFERYIIERKIDVLQENIGLMNSMIEISEKEIASGMGDLGSIYKMKARLADSENMLINEKNMVKSLTTELNYFMAADLNDSFFLDTNNLVKDYRNQPLLPNIDMLEINRSDIQKMNSQITSMELNQTMMSKESKPEFEITATHYAIIDNPDMYAVEAMVMIPFAPWSSKGYKSKVKSMGFQIQAMKQDKQAMLNMANQMVTMLALELITQYKEVDNYRNKVIPAYKKSFDTNLLSYSQNTGELMKTLLAWDDLFMAQMEYLRHLGVLLKAQADYEREMQIR